MAKTLKPEKGFYQVLWVEDDQDVIKTFSMAAEARKIQLTALNCWDDANNELESDYNRWDAIILDAKCKHYRDSEDDAVVFLAAAQCDISRLAEKNKRIIPWYIFSGGDENEISRSILEKRELWDADWPKKYYSKAKDKDKLLDNILKQVEFRTRYVVLAKYKDVFDAVDYCKFDKEVREILLKKLLIPLCSNEDSERDFKHIRIVLEDIFNSMVQNKLLPKWGRRVNLTYSSWVLSGWRKDKKGNYRVVDIEGGKKIMPKKRILPDILSFQISKMVQSIPTDHHGKNDIDAPNLKEYKESVSEKPYLLDAYTLILCDLILWYRKFLLNYDDSECFWEVID